MRVLNTRTMTNEVAKPKKQWQIRVLSKQTTPIRTLSTRTMANEVATHKDKGK